jgi:hypothetical protein
MAPLIDRTGRYRATDALWRRYALPRGVTPTTEDSMTAIARLLNIKPRALSEAWGMADMTHHPARSDQPPATKNIQVWQVLALMHMGLLDRSE